jgi:hypothetical protein
VKDFLPPDVFDLWINEIKVRFHDEAETLEQNILVRLSLYIYMFQIMTYSIIGLSGIVYKI